LRLQMTRRCPLCLLCCACSCISRWCCRSP
jgi:hypothetical protein